jgi:hypothetical protein
MNTIAATVFFIFLAFPSWIDILCHAIEYI